MARDCVRLVVCLGPCEHVTDYGCRFDLDYELVWGCRGWNGDFVIVEGCCWSGVGWRIGCCRGWCWVDTDGLHFMGLSVVEFAVEIGVRGKSNRFLAFMSQSKCDSADKLLSHVSGCS